jgi:hypothetical protein
MTDQFECAFVTGFRDKTRRICHIYAIHYNWKRRFWTYEGTPIESSILFFYWKYAPFFHILNDDMYMMLSVCCFWIFNKKKRCVKSWVWSVPKLEYDLLRRNASTNGRKTDLIERDILHRNPKHTIYVRYFSILLYLLNVQDFQMREHSSLVLNWCS